MSLPAWTLAALLLVSEGPSFCADKPPALEKHPTGVTAAPQSLSERAKTMRVNSKAFENFDPAPLLFEAEPSPTPAPVRTPERLGSTGSASAWAEQQNRAIQITRANYEKATREAAITATCPKATDADRREAQDRVDAAARAAGIRPKPQPPAPR